VGLAGGAWLWWTRGSESLRWQAVDRMIAQSHGTVPTISTQTLAERLNGPNSERLLLLDARAPEEYAISHIESARHYDPERAAIAMLDTVATNRPIAVYCSVGYRSAGVVNALREQGYTNVVNVEGSIFQWANEGRAVVQNGECVGQVHPYDAVWGQLLTDSLRATNAPAPYSTHSESTK
jgi:rhodanese-related sulfurtransferase